MSKMIMSAVTLCAACGIAAAADVAEGELDGQAVNNTLSSAQLLAPASFTMPMDAFIFGTMPTATVLGRGGNNDVDFYSLQTGPGPVYFDIDGASGFDTYLALFDSAGTLLGDADDSFPPDAGSASDLDAFLGSYEIPSAGTYYIAVSRSGNFAAASFSGSGFAELARPDGAFGGFRFSDSRFGDSAFELSGPQLGEAYRLHVTIPAPGGAGLAAAGLVTIGLRRRR
ncbi:MAG: PPC domain-containing protein [Phycisphaerales bacterium]|nr:PPC domain-containing protein [Phycisphaerales bacterium]